MVRKVICSVGFLCLLLALGAPRAMAQFGQMQGTVIGEDGKPLANAIISIDREDIRGHYEVKTDKSGKFFHAGLPLGKFSVSVMRDGKKFFTQGGITTRLSEPAKVEIDLQQERARTEAQAQGVAVPNNQAGQGGKMSSEQMAAIEKAAKERDEQIKKRQALTGKFDTAMQAMKDKNYDQAITEFQAAADVDPSQHVVFAQLGEAYSGKAGATKNAAEKKEFYDKSIESYQKALTLKPDDPSYHNNYALALANEGKVDEAQAELGKAAQLDPTNAGRYYFNLGAILVNTNHMKEAADAFRKATEADPNFADAYYQLGVSLTGMAAVDPKTGKVAPVPGTVEALQKYLQLAPTGPNADAAKGLLETLTGAVTTQVGTPTPQQGGGGRRR
jgi:tetratricopeptide (TPR) repeat protein